MPRPIRQGRDIGRRARVRRMLCVVARVTPFLVAMVRPRSDLSEASRLGRPAAATGVRCPARALPALGQRSNSQPGPDLVYPPEVRSPDRVGPRRQRA